MTAVWYLAESPAHAVAEVIQGMRNQPLEQADLTRFGHPLALVPITLHAAGGRNAPRIHDLCVADVLGRHEIRPDVLASWDFTQTQRIARHLFATNCLGFRWWSALSGDWHATVLFEAKLSPGVLQFGVPEPLTLRSEAVIQAARQLAIQPCIAT